MNLSSILFDLYGTIAFIPKQINEIRISEYLIEHCYKIYPQSIKAAFYYVVMIDYPKYGFKSWRSFLKRVFYRLGVKIDDDILKDLVRIFNQVEWRIYDDVEPALKMVKKLGYKTAIISTVPYFQYKRQLSKILRYIDVVVDGYIAGCEKSNPEMYIKTLKLLNTEPSKSIMIGDDPYLDVEVPKKVGIRSILLIRSGEKIDKLNSIDTVENLMDAIKIIIHKYR